MAGIKIEFGANTTPFNQAIAGVKNSISSLSSSLKGKIGAVLGFSGLAYSANRYIEKLDQIADDSRKLEVSTDFFQKLNFAAERSGASLGNVESAIKRLSRNIYDLSMDNKSAVQDFAMLGLTFDELKDKTPEEQFKVVLDSINKITNATEKSALAQKIFGKAGAELLLMFKDYNTLAEEISQKGLIQESTIQAADQLSDRFTDIKTSLAAIVSESGVFEIMAKGMNKLVESLNSLKNADKLPEGVQTKTEYRTTTKKIPRYGFYGQFLGYQEVTETEAIETPFTQPIDKNKLQQQRKVEKARDQTASEIRSNILKDISGANREKLTEDKRIKEAQYDYMLLVQRNKLSSQDFERFKLISEYNKKIAEAKSEELKNILESAKQEELTTLDKKQLDSERNPINDFDIATKKIEEMPIRGLFGGSAIVQENPVLKEMNKIQEKSLEYQKQTAESLKEIEKKSTVARYL